MARSSDILAAAAAEIGTVEEKGNRTKYGKAYGMDGVYWCMIFVWWVFSKVDKSVFYGGGKVASCSALMAHAIKYKQWVTKGYKPGDVLIFDLPGNNVRTDHTGILERVDGSYVVTIEGNTSSGAAGSQDNGDGVYRRRRPLSVVLGAYRPRYEDAEPDYTQMLQSRAFLAESTMKYLADYKYGKDLIRKLATMK